MKINHIIDKDSKNSNTWAFYGERERNREDYTSERYELMIFKYDSEYRYQLDSYKRNMFRNILRTDSKEEMKITLDLMGLCTEQVNIFMKEKSTGEINVKYSLIDLNEK